MPRRVDTSYYDSRLQAAVHDYLVGRLGIRTLEREDVVGRGRRCWEIQHPFSCCYDIRWESGTIAAHMASMKHIAAKRNVGRLDLKAALDERFIAARKIRRMREERSNVG